MRKIVAWVLGIGLAVNGLAMLAVPASWYDAVPGVAETGPFNPHFVRDIGAAYLVAGLAVMWFAINRLTRPAALAAAAFLAFQDAVLSTDGGGKRVAALNPIFGAEKILRFIAGIARKNLALQGIQLRAATVNGLAGFVLRETDGSVETAAFEHRDCRITATYAVRNPEKLHHVRF
jgi:hypothetical protein